MIEFRPIKVATGSADTEGRLVMHCGLLVAVIVQLAEPSHGEDCGRWYLEARFSGIDIVESPLFDDLDEAGTWLGDRLAKTQS